ncbi:MULTISPECIES: hypothetical protein [Caballeronia]|uniref:hypothetical protein n=1 Tax=Caballeronia TaxID=1827195 RepID=UPI001364736B|nr:MULTISPECIES: hypothetical protein [Caballeronia]MDR5770130.1 hypothetical protein [Caballeronia sp. LZ028]
MRQGFFASDRAAIGTVQLAAIGVTRIFAQIIHLLSGLVADPLSVTLGVQNGIVRCFANTLIDCAVLAVHLFPESRHSLFIRRRLPWIFPRKAGYFKHARTDDAGGSKN